MIPPSSWQNNRSAPIGLVSPLFLGGFTHSSTPKMEAVRSTETSVDFYRSILHCYRCENLKSNNLIVSFYIRVVQQLDVTWPVSCRLPTAAARVLSPVKSCGICGGQSGTFPLPILNPPNAPYSSTIRGWYNRPVSGRCTNWTQSHPTPRNLKKIKCILSLQLNCYTWKCVWSNGQYIFRLHYSQFTAGT
jgi:hypothetical protein